MGWNSPDEEVEECQARETIHAKVARKGWINLGILDLKSLHSEMIYIF